MVLCKMYGLNREGCNLNMRDDVTEYLGVYLKSNIICLKAFVTHKCSHHYTKSIP
jgi:hypothetical protein